MKGGLLSVCIATRDRADSIGQTLDNLMAQCGESVEIVVVDGASTDNTSAVIGVRAEVWPNLHFYPQTINSGVDGDYDKAVELAQGMYCWLMSDDDMLAEGAVRRVLAACEKGPDAVIVDAEVRTANLTQKIVRRRLCLDGEHFYGSEDAERFFTTCGQHVSFIGAVIVRRETWLNRKRRCYYGSEFIHVGVLFQAPLAKGVIVIGEPLIQIRYGVGNWTNRSFQVWMFKWPNLVWSFEWLSEHARSAVSPRHPWRNPALLALYRAKGWYSWSDFIRSIKPIAKPWQALLPALTALVPGSLLNSAALAYFKLWRRNHCGGLHDLRRSRYYLGRYIGI